MIATLHKHDNQEITLRDDQIAVVKEGKEILQNFNLLYLALMMRVGKTSISITIANEIIKEQKLQPHVLFVTKKKAMSSVRSDFEKLAPKFSMTLVNYESLHLVPANHKPSIVIVDEAHSCGAFPQPSQRTENLTVFTRYAEHVILMSGTPTPESFAQLYHQLWLSRHSPYAEYRNFYRWAEKYVNKRLVKRGAYMTTDYSDADTKRIEADTDHLFIRRSQKDVGFKNCDIQETIIKIPVSDNIHALSKILRDNRFYTFKDGSTITINSAVALQQKLHQLYSGTIKCDDVPVRYEDGTVVRAAHAVRKVLTTEKAEYIKTHYAGMKVAVFYKYIAEGDALRATLDASLVTDNPEEFAKMDAGFFVAQIQSASMGVNLSTADTLVFYNIDFSALQYWQSRARIQSFDKETPAQIHWLFAVDGIEEKIHAAVARKQDYTLRHFARDYSLRLAVEPNFEQTNDEL